MNTLGLAVAGELILCTVTHRLVQGGEATLQNTMGDQSPLRNDRGEAALHQAEYPVGSLNFCQQEPDNDCL